MNNVSQLRNNVERWLIHENYSFKDVKSNEDSFRIRIKDIGSFNIPIEIFEPKAQSNVLVLGGKVFLRNPQTARYNKLTDWEQEKFKNSVKDFCDSIRAIHKIFKEDGKVVIGIYLVLDKIERFTQENVLEALGKVTEMSEKTYQFINKTF
ncbi:MAG TPA: DUF2299 family protein [Nitrosopumilaceae archaeon]|jgi:hypothetical protein